jgi:hypothetical protein
MTKGFLMISFPSFPLFCTFLLRLMVLINFNSSAGRDGIPFSVYRTLRDIAAPLLLEVFLDLARGKTPPKGFNHGRLYNIPKNPSYTVDQTRPITVNNAANRIITSVMVTLITPALQFLIDSAQKGFVKGRQGAEHVEDLNHLFYEAVRNREDLFVLFLDTKKAFDSIDHLFVETMFDKVGMPCWCSSFLHAILDKARVFPALASRTNVSIPIKRGVKQGCPLSPLLFALAYDVLLVYLKLDSIDLIFAFADDLAIASDDKGLLDQAMTILDLFSEFSGLGINRDKTVVIKSRPFSQGDRAFFRELDSCWQRTVLADSHLYLGVLFGRKVTTVDVYRGALAKFESRIRSYRQALRSRSIDHRIVIVNVFLTTIFSYLIHFFIIPYVEVVKKVQALIARAIIPFNGGAFAYVHLITPTSLMGFKQPLRDLWASGLTALTSHTDLMRFNGLPHPPLIAAKPFLNTAHWDSMHIEDHRDAAALDLLHHAYAADFNGNVCIDYRSTAATRKVYQDAVTAAYSDLVVDANVGSSMTARLRKRWGLQGRTFAVRIRENASSIGKWLPAHFRANHIKLIFNALATDDKRQRRGGNGPAARRALGFPCYICGSGKDQCFHLHMECEPWCEPVRRARHYFFHAVGCAVDAVALEVPPASLVVGAYPAHSCPAQLFSAIVLFNHVVWDQRRIFFQALKEPASLSRATQRLLVAAVAVWDRLAPLKLRSRPLARHRGFVPPVPPAPRFDRPPPDIPPPPD